MNIDVSFKNFSDCAFNEIKHILRCKTKHDLDEKTTSCEILDTEMRKLKLTFHKSNNTLNVQGESKRVFDIIEFIAGHQMKEHNNHNHN